MTDTTVKIFSSSMSSAPTLNNTAGTLIALLDACLVNGFGSMTASAAVVASGVCTLTFGSAHSFVVGSVARVAGITTSGYTGLNADQKVAAVTTNTVSFATTLSDATLAGTITAMLAPTGWSKAFTGTNLAAYRSADINSTQPYLRVDDTGTATARVTGYQTMTDVSTGTYATPTASQQSGGYYWPKGSSSTVRNWFLIADTRCFYLCVACNSSYTSTYFVAGFGDLVPQASADIYTWFINGATADPNSGSVPECSLGYQCSPPSTTLSSGFVLARSYAGWGYATAGQRAAMGMNTGYPGSSASILTFPNGSDNALLLTDYLAMQSYTALRGRFPGVKVPLQYAGGLIYNPGELVSINSRSYLFVPIGTVTAGAVGFMVFDATGPWW